MSESRFSFPTVSPADLDYLRSIDSPTIANAIERFKIRDRCDGFIGSNVECRYPDLGTMVGYALTVTMSNEPGPVKGRDGFWEMFTALEAMPSPAVLAVKDISGAANRVALCGEVMATLAKRLGAVGFVTDGMVRDIHEVHELGLHYFSRGMCVSHANFWIDQVGVDIELDGETIRTGDLLHGDVNGIVVIPTEIAGNLKAAVDVIRTNEQELMTFVRGDQFTIEGAQRLTGYR